MMGYTFCEWANQLTTERIPADMDAVPDKRLKLAAIGVLAMTALLVVGLAMVLL